MKVLILTLIVLICSCQQLRPPEEILSETEQIRCFKMYKHNRGKPGDKFIKEYCDTIGRTHGLKTIHEEWNVFFEADTLLEKALGNKNNPEAEVSGLKLSLDTVYNVNNLLFYQTELFVRNEFGLHAIHLNGIGLIYMEGDYRTFFSLDRITYLINNQKFKTQKFSKEIRIAKQILEY